MIDVLEPFLRKRDLNKEVDVLPLFHQFSVPITLQISDGSSHGLYIIHELFTIDSK